MSKKVKSEIKLPNGIDEIELQNQIQKYLYEYQDARLTSLQKFTLKDILRRKNPYLYRSKDIITAEGLVRELLSAYLTSQEETMFGEILEKLAIYVSGKVDGGWKSSATGIDLEFDRDNIRYLVSIKSGPNWGNSDQIKKMIDNFKSASKTLRTTDSRINTRCVNGCCYGKANVDSGDYTKMAGETFWTFLTKDADFYLDIIKPFGYKAKENSERFEIALGAVINKFTEEILTDFCDPETKVLDWKKIVEFNSGEKKSPAKGKC